MPTVKRPTPIPAISLPTYNMAMLTPAVWIMPPIVKIKDAIKIVPLRPKGSEKPAINAPTKHPPVKSATTVPLREWASAWRNSDLKDLDATTSAITPRSYPYKNEPSDAKLAMRNWYTSGFMAFVEPQRSYWKSVRIVMGEKRLGREFPLPEEGSA